MTRGIQFKSSIAHTLMRAGLLLWLLLAFGLPCYSQNLTRDLEILGFMRQTIQENYYDPKLRGVDFVSVFKTAEAQLKKSKSDQESMIILASILMELDDSHTIFLPPVYREFYNPGWRMMTFGEKCVITYVEPESEAEKKGLKVGDVVLQVDGVKPWRKDLWKIEYLFRSLSPAKVRQLVVQSAGEAARTVVAAAITKQTEITTPDEAREIRKKNQQRNAERVYGISNEVGLWRIPAFSYYEQPEIDQILEKIKSYKKLVLDLRGNPGGGTDIVAAVIGCLINRTVKVSDHKTRKNSTPWINKPHKKGAFEGELVVLVDSKSTSGAEVVARVTQLEKRGMVVGDQTGGAVMVGASFYKSYLVNASGLYSVGSNYGMQVTIADMVMSDGKSLERIGVTPDELLLPKPEDLAGKRDPVLARAAELLGANLDPAKAWLLLHPPVVPQSPKKP